VLRFLAFVAMLLLPGLVPLIGQSYESSFTPAKYDRAKGPATMHAGVEVNVASGAASMEIPLGPGIGARGLHYTPKLSARFAPQYGVSTHQTYSYHVTACDFEYFTVQNDDSLYWRGFGKISLTPGTLDLPLCETSEDQLSFSTPDSGGTELGQVPSGVDINAANQILQDFNIPGSIGQVVGDAILSRDRYIRVGSDGSLILGLVQPGANTNGTDALQDYYSSAMGGSGQMFEWPRRFLVVKGDKAYLFEYVAHRYYKENRSYISTNGLAPLFGSQYVLTKILNRFGESIDITYDPDGIGHTATWNTAESHSIKVRIEWVSDNAPSDPTIFALRNTGTPTHPITGTSLLRVNYQGLSSTYDTYDLILSSGRYGTSLQKDTGGGPGTLQVSGVGGYRGQWAREVQGVQPIAIQSSSDEKIEFQYASGSSITWSSINGNPTVLSGVKYNNRLISLTWEPYRYRPNYATNAWGSLQSPPRRPAWAYGVKTLDDKDLVSGQVRTTTYSRKIPEMNWAEAALQAGDPIVEYWVNRDFYTIVKHPDQQTTLHRFVEPSATVNATSGAEGVRNMAYLKHIERETRYYAAGVSCQSDLSITSPANSNAYRWIVSDRLDVRTVGAPTGSLYDQAVPYATRTRTWDKESNVVVAAERTDWDNSKLCWTVSHKITGLPSASDSLAFDALSLAQAAAPYSAPGYANGIEERTNFVSDNIITKWFLDRVGSQAHVRSTDSTGYGVTTGSKPTVQTTRDSQFNTVTDITQGDTALSVTTSFTYKGLNGRLRAEIDKVAVSGAQNAVALEGSGQVGIKSYDYDANGFLSAITTGPGGTTNLTVGQVSDELGRPITQTDPNGRATNFAWDSAGRIHIISPPGSEFPTVIDYHPDFLGATVTRGAEVHEYRYNGFGELVLERRKGPNATWSHKILGLDTFGRPTGETVWIAGRGDDHETLWASPKLTKGYTYTTVEDVCKRWGPIDPDTGERACVSWTSGEVSVTVNPLYSGSHRSYDGRGRVIESIDANGLTIATSYSGWVLGAQTKRIVAPGTSLVQTTTFNSDSNGRLVQVIDALNQKTEYFYDASERNTKVKQYDGNSHVQTRTWSYNGLGWLTRLVQPESGTTTYSRFTVMGKPKTTNYNGRAVSVVYDLLGRVTSLVAADGSVNQAFTFDTAVNALGSLASSLDGSVKVEYGYDAATGRVNSLTTYVPIDGAERVFTQTYAYDSNGARTRGTVQGASWTQSYHDAAGMPNLLTYSNASCSPALSNKTVASSPWSSYDTVSWAPLMVDYGNGARTQFSYGVDQVRLAGMSHSVASGATLKAKWKYQYDATGNLYREFDNLVSADGDTKYDQYGYDALNRLISAVIKSPTYGEQLQSFGYDAFGNRISSNTIRVISWAGAPGASAVTQSAASTVPTIYNMTLNADDSALWQKNQIPSTALGVGVNGYDSQGNLQSFERVLVNGTKVPITATYDSLGRVKTVAYTLSSATTTETYQYRADGLRTVVQEIKNGVAQPTRIQIYNDAHQLVSMWTKASTGNLKWKRDILYVGTKEAAEIDSAGLHVTQVDRLGSPRLVVGPTGLVESTQKYLPFGELLEQSGSFVSAKGYTNHEQTDLSGLVYMQARFYVPWAGRFSSPDPARDQHFEETQSWNIYSYVQNNPIMSTDPTGLMDGEATPPPDPDGKSVSATKAKAANENQVGVINQNTANLQKERLSQTGVPWYLGGNSSLVDKGLTLVNEALTTYNPGYQMLAQPADLAAATINAAANQDIPMSSNLGKAAEGGASTTSLLANHSWEVPVGILALEGGVSSLRSALASATQDFFAGTRYSDKVLGQMKKGDLHSFPEEVKLFQGAGKVTKITGGDGVKRELLRIPGGYKGKTGAFEFMKEPTGVINHRFFKATGIE